MKKSRTALGAHLTDARAERGVTQAVVADAIGCRSVSMGRWERGVEEPSDERLIDLASYYGLSLQKLVLLKFQAKTGVENIV